MDASATATADVAAERAIKPPVEWSAEAVADWFSEMQLKANKAELIPLLIEAGVTGDMLADLADEDLQNDFGVMSGFARKKILKVRCRGGRDGTREHLRCLRFALPSSKASLTTCLI
jgi:hypothetical protein